jgi:hypothetical protein
MLSSGMLCHVALVRTNISEEHIASIVRVTRIVNVVPGSPTLVTLMMEAIRSSKTLVLTRTIGHTIPEDSILHSHHCEKLKSYNAILIHKYPFIFKVNNTLYKKVILFT